MRAQLGDQLVVESQSTGATRRDGEIVGLHLKPWAGGEREMWVSIEPTRLTGRRISSTDQ